MNPAISVLILMATVYLAGSQVRFFFRVASIRATSHRERKEKHGLFWLMIALACVNLGVAGMMIDLLKDEF